MTHKKKRPTLAGTRAEEISHLNSSTGKSFVENLNVAKYLRAMFSVMR